MGVHSEQNPEGKIEIDYETFAVVEKMSTVRMFIPTSS